MLVTRHTFKSTFLYSNKSLKRFFSFKHFHLFFLIWSMIRWKLQSPKHVFIECSPSLLVIFTETAMKQKIPAGNCHVCFSSLSTPEGFHKPEPLRRQELRWPRCGQIQQQKPSGTWQPLIYYCCCKSVSIFSPSLDA